MVWIFDKREILAVAARRSGWRCFSTVSYLFCRVGRILISCLAKRSFPKSYTRNSGMAYCDYFSLLNDTVSYLSHLH